VAFGSGAWWRVMGAAMGDGWSGGVPWAQQPGACSMLMGRASLGAGSQDAPYANPWATPGFRCSHAGCCTSAPLATGEAAWAGFSVWAAPAGHGHTASRALAAAVLLGTARWPAAAPTLPPGSPRAPRRGCYVAHPERHQLIGDIVRGGGAWMEGHGLRARAQSDRCVVSRSFSAPATKTTLDILVKGP